MSITAAELLVMVRADGADNVELALAGVSAAVIAAGVESVKMAANFQQGVNRLKTGAGDVTDNMTTLGNGILKVSTDTGVLTLGTDGLNAAMYQIISSGQRGAQALDTLRVAAKGAQIEQANVVDVANVLSGAMTNYGTKQFNATQFMNGFITAVQHGKITLQDLATAMGPIDPIAQSLGVHFNDVAAAMTTQTNAMIPAARAATGLRFMLMALENPTKKARDEMAALGLDSVKVGDEMKVSLPGALQMIVDAAKKVGPEGSVPFNRAVGDMVGGLRGLSAFLALTGPHMKDFAANSAMILKAMQQNKDAVIGWDTAQQNFNVQMNIMAASVQALMIKLGTALLPVLTQLLAQVSPTIQAFSDWIDKSGVLSGITQTLSGWIGKLGEAFNYVADAFDQVFNRGGNLIDTFDHATAVIKPLEPVMKTLTDTFDRASGVMGKLDPIMKPVLDTFDRATSVFDHTAGAVQGVDQAAQGAPNAWIPFWTFVKNVIADVKRIDWGGIGAGLERIRVAISQMDWGKVGAFFSGIATSISKVDWGAVGKDIEKIATGLTKVDWGKVGSGISGMVNSLLKVDWGKTGANLKSIFDELSKVDWKGTISGIVDLITEFQKVVSFFQLFGNALNFAANLAGVVARKIVEFFQWLYDALVGHSIIPDLINAIVRWFASLPGRLAGIIQGTVNNIVSWFAQLPGRLAGVIIGTVNSIVGWFAQLPGRLGALILGLVNSIAGWWGQVPGRLAAFGGSIISALTSPFQSAANTISGILGTIGGWVNTAVGNVGNLISKISQVHIPSFASGIENFGGGLAYVHAGEVLTYLPSGTSVTPANKVGSMSGSAPVIHNHIDVYLDGTRMTGQLMPRIVQQVRQATGVRF